MVFGHVIEKQRGLRMSETMWNTLINLFYCLEGMMVALCSKVQKVENIDAAETPIFETDFYYQKRKAA